MERPHRGDAARGRGDHRRDVDPASVATLMHLELRGLVVNAGGRYQRRPSTSIPTLASPLLRLIHRSRPGRARMPDELPQPSSSRSARSRTTWPSNAACRPTPWPRIGGTCRRQPPFLTRNRSSLGRDPSAVLRRFLAQQHTLGYARATIARRVGAIRTFYRWAVAGRTSDRRPVAPARPAEGREPAPDRAPGEGGGELAEAPA